MAENNDTYLIWSNEHRAWWGPESRGYVVAVSKAGRYSREQALACCTNAIPGSRGIFNELPVRLQDVVDFVSNQIIPSPLL